MKHSFESAFKTIKGLCETFKINEKHFLSTSYQEAEVRKYFIDKFFMALGWDILHNEQKNPYEQEVKVERSLTISGAQKRADYSFCLAPNYRDPKFFVEAKKPSSNLRNADSYFQTIRYAWHKSNPIAVLTDFNEFHILDCRFGPDISTVLNRQIKTFHYLDYCNKEKFAEIYWLFAHEAVAKNSIENFAESLPKPRGKAMQKTLFALEKHQTIDEDFLNEIEEKREILAKAFKRNDEELSSEQLTEATQKTIDRLVFIRFLEDKLIEQEHYVHEFGETAEAWQDFIALCRKLDAKYNGIVFKKSFIDSPKFKGPVDSEFHSMCQDICHINSRFLYNEIPIHILGSIYERFLGKIIHATPKQVKVQLKEELRKAGGVFYTPKYIVDYIVENTIGKQIQGKTPDQISKMHFSDIACGSGSFLIGVFDTILNHYNKYYQENPLQAKRDGCHLKDQVWVLSIRQKQNILKNNIFGVDIDAQAVEVTQLSLSLKMLEDESTATANEMQVLFHEKILPDMSKNIICGNSLISDDIETSLFSELEDRKLNRMDYEGSFPDIMKKGGFDTIVGNPPYIVLSKEGYSQSILTYLMNKYPEVTYQLDAYLLFIIKAIKVSKGKIGYIVPNAYLGNLKIKEFRKYLLKQTSVEQIVSLPNDVFKGASVDTTILILDKKIKKNNEIIINEFRDNTFSKFNTLNQSDLQASLDYKINIHIDSKTDQILQKILKNSDPINKFTDINRGVHAYRTDGFGKSKYGAGYQTQKDYDERSYHSERKINKTYKIEVRGKNIFRYYHTDMGIYLSYGDWLAEPREIKYFNQPRIYLRKIVGETLYASFSDSENIPDQSVYMAISKSNSPYNLNYLLGIINSKLSVFVFRHLNNEFDKLFPQIKVTEFKALPIPTINFKIKSQKSNYDKLIKLVEQITSSIGLRLDSKTDKDLNYYTRRVFELNNQIDKMVYTLFNLTQEEIRIVEESVSK